MSGKRKRERKQKKPLPMYTLFLYFGATVFYLETFLKGCMNGHVFYSGILISLLFGTAFAVVLAAVVMALPVAVRKSLAAVFLFFLSLLFAAQVVYYSIFRNFFTAYSAGNAGKVMEFAGEALYAMKVNALRILLAFVPFILFFVLTARRSLEGRLSWKRSAVLLAVLVAAQGLGLGLVNLDDRGEVSPCQMYYNVQHPEMAVSRLGLLTYMRLDTQRSMLGMEPLRLRARPPVVTVNPLLSAPQEENPDSEYNVLDLDFDALAAGEADPDIRDLHAYVRDVFPTEKNDHTGRYEGYNLIFITAEAFSHLAVREDVTPTLYRMMHEGCLFTDFYTAYWGVSTSDGEYVATTSLVPKSGAWSYSQSSGNAMPFAMGNELKALGYKTLAYHNHSYDYYNRDKSHPNMGYVFKGIGNGLNVTPVWPASDLEMMQVTIPEFIGNDRSTPIT